MDAFFRNLLNRNSPPQLSPQEQQRLNDENQRRKEQHEQDEKDTEFLREYLETEYIDRIRKTTIDKRDEKNRLISKAEVSVPKNIAQAFITDHKGSYQVENGRIKSSNCIILHTNKDEKEIYLGLFDGTSRDLINKILSEIKQIKNLKD